MSVLPRNYSTLTAIHNWVKRIKPSVIEIPEDARMMKLKEFNQREMVFFDGVPIFYGIIGTSGFNKLMYQGKEVIGGTK